jgi:serine/threonine protein kinase
MLENKARALEKKIAIEKIKKVLDLKNSLILIVAKVAASLVILHEIKIVHCDLHLENIMCDAESGDPKLIDLGCASKEGVWPYPKNKWLNDLLTWHMFAPEVVLTFDSDMEGLEAAVIHPAADVYSLGCIAMYVWFTRDGVEKILSELNYVTSHKVNRNVFIYGQFYSKIRNIIEELNFLLPPALQYSQAEINFIVNFLKSCMHPDPRERPTSAQACHILECFAAGCIDFDEVKKVAEKDRPTPKDYFSEETIGRCEWAAEYYNSNGLMQKFFGPPEPSTAENSTPFNQHSIVAPKAIHSQFSSSPPPDQPPPKQSENSTPTDFLILPYTHITPPFLSPLSEDQPPSDQPPEDQ